MPIFIEKLDLGAIFDFREHRFRQKMVKRRGRDREGERPCRDPAFLETIAINVPLGPTGF